MADLEWKKANEWIVSTRIEPRNGKDLGNCEDLFDFAEVLRDGVILCQVANKLSRECAVGTMSVNSVEKHTFLCKRNINIFLRACHKTFGIDEDKLFTADDLYNVTNFKAVMRTISLLSQTFQATTVHRLTPFCAENRDSRNSQEEDLYGTLPGILEKKISIDPNPEKEESIYDEVENYRAIYDTLVSRARPVKPAKTTVDNTSKRGHIINEILETEDGYLANLKVMVESYITPLKALLSNEDKETIFMNTEHIYSFHLQFNRELSNRKDFSPQESIKLDATAFTKHRERFLIYAVYCAGLATAQKHVAELCNKDSTLKENIEAINRRLNRKFPLQDQLSVLFQRILKYPLLLRDLKKHTPEGHEDSESINKAFDTMDDIAKYINDYKRDVECVREIEQIARSLKYDVPLLSDPLWMRNKGRHIKDGELHLFFGSDKREKRSAFLFEHILLLCQTRRDTNDVKEIYDLAKFSIVDVNNIGKGNFSQGWALNARVKDGVSEKKNCKLFAKTQQEKMYWVSEISKCIKIASLSDYQGKLDKHEMDLTTFPFKQNNYCTVCDKLMRGQVSQGYSCLVKGCKLVIHKDCLDKCPKCDPAPVPKPHGIPRSPRAVRANRTKSQAHIRPKEKVEKKKRAATLQTPLTVDEMHEVNKNKLTRQTTLDTCSWFSGTLSRDQAGERLKGNIDGSFLIRENEKGWLVLSIMYRKSPFHIKIAQKNNLYYLTDAKQFPSVEELLSYYTQNSLESSFPAVPISLSRMITKPVRRTVIARYNWEAKSEKELSLKVGQIISVLSDEGNWWLGRNGSEQGFFPRNHVEDYD